MRSGLIADIICLFLPILHFPEQQVLEKGMMGGEAGDGKSGEAVTKAAFEKVAAGKGGWRSRRDAERGGAASLLEHLARA